MDMEENKKRFLDKILKWMVDGTEVHPYVRTWFPTFLDMEDYPISLRPLDISNLSLFPIVRFYDYCRKTYDLSVEEIEYIWHKYTIIIIDKFNNEKPINESEDRRKRFLDKVVDFLVKDTKVDYDKRTLFFPFTYKRSLRQGTNNLTPFHKLLFDSYIPIDGFMEYIKELYDITSIEDITHVWETYKVIMNKIVFGDNSYPLYFNESEKGSINEDSRQDLIDKVDERVKKYLDKVVDFIIKETVIDYGIDKFNPVIKDEVLWYPPFSERPYSHRQSMYNTGANYDFNNYCQEVFSIFDEGEQLYVWEKYRKLLDFKMRGMMINESDDKKQKYLDKILKWFVDDTIIDYGTGVILYPFSPIGPTGKPLPSFIDDLKNKLSWGMSSDVQITCRDTYGLNYDETKYIWDKYKTIIKDRYNKESIMFDLKPINESDDKRQVFLYKIIDWLVSDTDVDGLWFNPPYKTGLIYAENSITLSSLYKQTFNLLKYVTDEEEVKFVIQMNYFKRFCEEQYGLTEEEITYVWEGYMKNLYESEKYNSLNESEDKKQVYLDKIVDWLVGDTEVDVNYNWFSPPYYYPGSTSGRTGFKSVYEHTFGLLRDTNYSGLDTQLIYFNHYCKNNYGLTGEETKIVWYEYMKQLKESYDWRF